MKDRRRAEGRGPGRWPQETNLMTYLAGNVLDCALVKPSAFKFSNIAPPRASPPCGRNLHSLPF
jgi:hypothetical protein